MRVLLEWTEKLSSRHAILGSSFLGALLLQSAVFPHLTIFGAKPDLLMVIVACWALLYGPQEGFVAGLTAGLVQDLTFGRYIGLHALTKTLAGFAAGVAESKIFKETIWVPTAAVGLAVFAQEVAVWLCLRVLGVTAPVSSLVSVVLPGAGYSALLAPLIYRQLFLYRARELAREKEAAGGSGQAAARR